MSPSFMGRSCKRSIAVGWLGAWPSELGSGGPGSSRQGVGFLMTAVDASTGRGGGVDGLGPVTGLKGWLN